MQLYDSLDVMHEHIPLAVQRSSTARNVFSGVNKSSFPLCGKIPERSIAPDKCSFRHLLVCNYRLLENTQLLLKVRVLCPAALLTSVMFNTAYLVLWYKNGTHSQMMWGKGKQMQNVMTS